MSTRILPLDQVRDCQGCVLAYGHFSTIHPGHIRYLRHARSLRKQLVVALVGDEGHPQAKPYPFNQQERAEALGLLGLADAIVLLQSDDLSPVISQLQPSIVVLGTELEDSARLQQPLALLKSQGGSVQFHAGGARSAPAAPPAIPDVLQAPGD